MEMKIPYNVKGKERRELAQSVSEVLNTVPVYKGVPSYAYEIGGCELDRQGTLLIGDRLQRETVNSLLAYLAEQGFEGKATEPNDEYSGLVVSMPRDTFTEKALENLTRLAESKANLIGHAFGTDLPKPVITQETVSFPWFPETTDPDEVKAYTQFIDKLCEMARTQKRVVGEVRETDNEKYAFRCFLLRLGFIGPEYKTARSTLLRNLTGNSAFRHGAKKQ